uniref:Uncharacterized protein n=1 Tax=Melanthalia intermedia TaxID=172989 RepID=A0A345UAP4_9FLOR|nr:hypothetical protein [Melanthalia intermedia]AXI97530.1 hypothetical protein [Melanthalia intermedia]
MNNPKVSTVSIVKYTVALILGLAKNLLLNHSHVKNNNYVICNLINTIDISEKTLSIIGLWSIGFKASSICSSAFFNEKVLPYDLCILSQKVSNCGAKKFL